MAVSASQQDMVRVYDAAGKFSHEIGRRGNGPGEYEDPYFVAALAGDSLLIFDSPGFSLLDGAGRFVRRFRTPTVGSGMLPTSLVVRSTRQILFAGNILTQSALGLPFHLIALADPPTVRSMGMRSESDSAGRVRVSEWNRIGPSTGNEFWAGSMKEYRIRHHSGDGGVTAEYVRLAPWFVVQPPKRGRFTVDDYLSTPPSAMIGAIREHRDSLLWVVLHLPAKEWRKGMRVEGTAVLEPLWHHLYSSRIEVVDPKSRVVLASAPFDGYIFQIIDGDYFASARENVEGEPVIDIWRYQLLRPR